MKRRLWKYVVSAVCIMCFFQSFLVACNSRENEAKDTIDADNIEYDYDIYCVDSTGMKLDKWGYNLSVQDLSVEDKVYEIMGAFSGQPSDDNMTSADVVGLSELSYNINGNILKVDCDKSYKKLDSLSKLFFKAALTLTVTQIQEIEYVSLTVSGQPLTDSKGNKIGYLSQNSFIMYEDSEDAITTDFFTTIYYSEDGESLTEVSQTYDYDRMESPEMFVLELLRQDGVNHGVIPADVAINNAYTQNGICYVDFDEKINDKKYTGIKAEVMLYAIVNSLTELQGVTGVKLTIDGRDDVLFRGEISLEKILRTNLNIVKTTEIKN